MDDIAAKAIWIMILRFMGDMAEAKCEEDVESTHFNYPAKEFVGTVGKSSVMQRLTMKLSKSAAQNKEFQAAVTALNETESKHQRLIRTTLKRKTKFPDLLRKTLDNAEEIEFYEQVLNVRSSNLEKLHFIIGHGILRPTLRDEILAQICKQLTNNPYRTSFAKGWILLSLCIGCFPPGKHFEHFLRCFIQHGPMLYAPYCENRLDRTLKNGPRTQPPSWLELQATRNQSAITLNVFLSDGNMKKLQVDSASTAKEAVQQLAEHIGLLDRFGFSIVITIFDKVMSLGNGNEHIMDAISNCEQYAKEQGQNEKNALWKLYLRKEMFSAWYDPSVDPLATYLIYKQITRGLNFGEYRFRTEKDVAMICALEYYVEQGVNMDSNVLRKLIPDFVPNNLLTAGESLRIWEELIMETFAANEYVKSGTPKQAMEDICLFAQLTWFMYFSRYFEAVRTAGPKLITDNVVIAINSNGVYFVDETEQVLAELSYAELCQVTCVSAESSNLSELHIETVQKENFTFKCYDAADIVELINLMLKNLKERSKYGIAIEDYKPALEEREGRLFLLKGDLVQFDADITGAQVMAGKKRWLPGICNDELGEFPVEVVSVLATLVKPTEKLLQLYKESAESLHRRNLKLVKYTTIQRQRMHTLRKFAAEHFRDEIIWPTQAQLHTVKSTNDELWRHSYNMLKAPLLKVLLRYPENFQKALVIFYNILKYMGDTPHGKQSINTDLIFKPALECETLCDELYCQLMKQLTANRLQHSEERGWDLMYLATGVMYPSSLVMKELLKFLNTRTHVLAAESLKRLKRTLANGQRKRPPHAIEVEGIQQRFMHIYHKIYFPDGSVEAFEIESFTRAAHITQDIGKRFELKSCEGFSLFVKIGNKVFSMPETEFAFDFINELEEWMKLNLPSRSWTQVALQYQLYFMKKLWFNVVPGRDRNADMIFYYPQEAPKYLSGYYKVDTDLAITMAGLIYVVGFGTSSTHLHKIGDVLPHLVPEDLIILLKVTQWRPRIIQCVSGLLEEHVDECEARQRFLSHLAAQQMFGSTFFLVKQSGDQNLPETILIAINKRGFHIIHPEMKDILQSYGYGDLSFWSSGNTYFHMRFGNMIGASKLLCTTTQGYKMDDLLTSYIKYFKEK
ncbi:myosin-VIIa isoform X2 [Bactrocera dorsalis]|uniref:Myosin-VIIa isoform X2 n=1 Tax=Bactrocera dorsalis TaxID=27457 RepID=A0ABM3K3H4_BACDO|nr:myosin-VIIa isoform X2 [Bactrocera dorsalis]